MDGANKYVRGDAVAGLLITGVNIGVGLLLGVFEHGMPVAEAFRVFTTLTIGDGWLPSCPRSSWLWLQV